jgi:hypothetical protein
MPPGSSRPREVFLSHASADRIPADAIAATLRAHGVAVWYSTTNLVGAQQWHDQIGAALRRCDWFAVLLSPSSVRSTWVKRELVFALNQSRYEGRIVPAYLRACSVDTLSWTLGEIQSVHFAGDYVRGCRGLLATWGLQVDAAKVVRPKRSRRR